MYEPRQPKPPVVIEGLRYADPKWVLVDAGPIQVHLMTELARQTWNVEENHAPRQRSVHDAPPHRRSVRV